MRLSVFIVLVIAIALIAQFDRSSALNDNFIDHRAKLRKDLFSNGRYDRYNSPMEVNSTWYGLSVHMRLVVLHIVNVDEETSSVTVNGWHLMAWSDPRLIWNPSDYGDANYIRVAEKSIWIPDVLLYNDYYAYVSDNSADLDMHIYSDGFIFWVAPVTMRSTCYADLKYYPFDQHTCTMMLGSWFSDTKEMSLTADYKDDHHEAEVLGNFFTENPKWKIVQQDQDVRNVTYSCCPGSHYQIYEIKLLLSRRSPFYKFMLVSPSVMAMILTLALFWLPPEMPGAKFTLGGIVIFIDVALLLFLGWRLPAGGQSIPSIVLFSGNALVMASLSLIVAIVTHRISRTSGKKSVPDWLKAFLNGFGGKVLCLNGVEANIWAYFISKVHSFSNTRDKASYISSCLKRINFRKFENDPQLIDSGEAQIEQSEEQDGEQRLPEKCGNEWTEVATAVDRMFFLFYCFVFAIILLASFTQ